MGLNGLSYINFPTDTPWSEVLDMVEKAWPEHPEDELTIVKLIVTLSNVVTEKKDLGLRAADRLLQIAIFPDDRAEALIFHANVLFEERKDLDRAIELYTEAYALSRDYQGPCENLFAIYMERKEYETALHWAKLMSMDEGMDHIGLEFEGKALTELGRIDEAMEAFQKSIDLDCSPADSYSGLGNCYLLNSDFQQASENFIKAFEVCHYPEPLYAYGAGYAYQLMDDPYRAMKWYAKALDIDPSYPNALNNMAVLNLELSNTWKEAVPYLLKAVELSGEAINDSMKVVYRNLWAYHTQILEPEKAAYYHTLVLQCMGFSEETADFLGSFGEGDDDDDEEDDDYEDKDV